jgi:hypothetical protein
MLLLPSNKVIMSAGVVMGLSYVLYRFYRRNNKDDNVVLIHN